MALNERHGSEVLETRPDGRKVDTSAITTRSSALQQITE